LLLRDRPQRVELPESPLEISQGARKLGSHLVGRNLGAPGMCVRVGLDGYGFARGSGARGRPASALACCRAQAPTPRPASNARLLHPHLRVKPIPRPKTSAVSHGQLGLSTWFSETWMFRSTEWSVVHRVFAWGDCLCVRFPFRRQPGGRRRLPPHTSPGPSGSAAERQPQRFETRRKTRCHGFHASSRYTVRPPAKSRNGVSGKPGTLHPVSGLGRHRSWPLGSFGDVEQQELRNHGLYARGSGLKAWITSMMRPAARPSQSGGDPGLSSAARASRAARMIS